MGEFGISPFFYTNKFCKCFASKIYRSIFVELKTETLKNKYNKPHNKISDYEFSTHSQKQLETRFKLSTTQVSDTFPYFKKGNITTQYNQVRNKIVNYPHEEVYYNEKFNLMLVCDTITKKICTAMFLIC